MDWHTLESIAVALIVTGCTAYAVWALMPAAWKRRLRGLPPVAARGCGGSCGCDAASGPPSQAVVQFHRRPR